MKGRLKESVLFWEKIGVGSKVLEIISQGYKIPFFEIPQPSSFKNNKSAPDNSEFVSSSIQELIRTKRVVEVPFIAKVTSSFSVSSNKGKKRLILDLCYVNRHVWKDKVKFENWKIFENYLQKNGYVFTFDLKPFKDSIFRCFFVDFGSNKGK